MSFDLVIAEDDYAKWSDGRYHIVKYSQWDGVKGIYFMGYDTNNMSKRVMQKPVSTLEDAIAACNTEIA